MSAPCGITAALPWLAPCCPDCAQRAGATGDTPPTSTAGLSGAGGLLVLAAIFVGVLYGEKVLGKLGG